LRFDVRAELGAVHVIVFPPVFLYGLFPALGLDQSLEYPFPIAGLFGGLAFARRFDDA